MSCLVSDQQRRWLWRPGECRPRWVVGTVAGPCAASRERGPEEATKFLRSLYTSIPLPTPGK